MGRVAAITAVLGPIYTEQGISFKPCLAVLDPSPGILSRFLLTTTIHYYSILLNHSGFRSLSTSTPLEDLRGQLQLPVPTDTNNSSLYRAYPCPASALYSR